MIKVNWDEIKYFNPEEFNYPDMLEHNLLINLDKLREELGCAIIINKGTGQSDYRKGDKGYHGKGMAIDCHLSDPLQRRLFTIAKIASKYFHGVGMYPFWNIPGFHFDIRPKEKEAFWVQPKKNSKNYIYI